jgi:hypothetical protein
MSLLADPTITYNSAGNVLAGTTSIAASSSSTGNIVDFSTSLLGGDICVRATGGSTVASTNGCQIQIFKAGDSSPHYDTVATFTQTLAMTASTASQLTISVPTGKYSVSLTNLDSTNAITAGITSNPAS